MRTILISFFFVASAAFAAPQWVETSRYVSTHPLTTNFFELGNQTFVGGFTDDDFANPSATGGVAWINSDGSLKTKSESADGLLLPRLAKLAGDTTAAMFSGGVIRFFDPSGTQAAQVTDSSFQNMRALSNGILLAQGSGYISLFKSDGTLINKVSLTTTNFTTTAEFSDGTIAVDADPMSGSSSLSFLDANGNLKKTTSFSNSTCIAAATPAIVGYGCPGGELYMYDANGNATGTFKTIGDQAQFKLAPNGTFAVAGSGDLFATPHDGYIHLIKSDGTEIKNVSLGDTGEIIDFFFLPDNSIAVDYRIAKTTGLVRYLMILNSDLSEKARIELEDSGKAHVQDDLGDDGIVLKSGLFVTSLQFGKNKGTLLLIDGTGKILATTQYPNYDIGVIQEMSDGTIGVMLNPVGEQGGALFVRLSIQN